MPNNPSTTIYIRNLDDRVNERIIYDLMVQAGPLWDVHIPRDRETQKHKGYAFAEYEDEESARYALQLFPGLVTLYNKSLGFAFSNSPSGASAGDKAATSDGHHGGLISPTGLMPAPPPRLQPLPLNHSFNSTHALLHHQQPQGATLSQGIISYGGPCYSGNGYHQYGNGSSNVTNWAQNTYGSYAQPPQYPSYT